MKAIVKYVSKSGNSVSLSIVSPIAGTKLLSSVSGFVAAVPGAYVVGDEIELPKNTVIIKELRTSADSGETFTWLNIS